MHTNMIAKLLRKFSECLNRHYLQKNTKTMSFSYTKATLILLVSVLFSGCSLLMRGDGYLSLKGNIMHQSEGACLLNLGSETNNSIYRSREVFGKFEQGFTVSPSNKRYLISIVCGGEQVYSQLVTYSGSVNSIDLGIIPKKKI